MGDAIFRQKNGVLGVGIVAPCGIVTPEQLIGLGKLSMQAGSLGSKFTTRQTVIFLIPEEKLEEFRQGVTALGLKVGSFGEVVRNVKSCAGGEEFCLRALTDVVKLGVALQERFMDQPVPHDFKISVAGCHRGCTDPLCADFGVIATGPDKFSIYIGGRGGSRTPVHAEKIVEEITAAGVEAVLEYVLEKYRALGMPKERLCKTIAREGLASFIPGDGLLDRYRPVEEENDFIAFLEG